MNSRGNVWVQMLWEYCSDGNNDGYQLMMEIDLITARNAQTCATTLI